MHILLSSVLSVTKVGQRKQRFLTARGVRGEWGVWSIRGVWAQWFFCCLWRGDIALHAYNNFLFSESPGEVTSTADTFRSASLPSHHAPQHTHTHTCKQLNVLLPFCDICPTCFSFIFAWFSLRFSLFVFVYFANCTFLHALLCLPQFPFRAAFPATICHIFVCQIYLLYAVVSFIFVAWISLHKKVFKFKLSKCHVKFSWQASALPALPAHGHGSRGGLGWADRCRWLFCWLS